MNATTYQPDPSKGVPAIITDLSLENASRSVTTCLTSVGWGKPIDPFRIKIHPGKHRVEPGKLSLHAVYRDHLKAWDHEWNDYQRMVRLKAELKPGTHYRIQGQVDHEGKKCIGKIWLESVPDGNRVSNIHEFRYSFRTNIWEMLVQDILIAPLLP